MSAAIHYSADADAGQPACDPVEMGMRARTTDDPREVTCTECADVLRQAGAKPGGVVGFEAQGDRWVEVTGGVDPQSFDWRYK